MCLTLGCLKPCKTKATIRLTARVSAVTLPEKGGTKWKAGQAAEDGAKGKA